jgi:hypothetical protein
MPELHVPAEAADNAERMTEAERKAAEANETAE